MGFVSDLFGGGGDDAAKAAKQASQTQADYQREALAYLKEREQLPQAYREAALQSLGAEYGVVPGEDGGIAPSGASIAERARQSEVYKALLGGRDAGEEAILRNASATGGLRSGNVQQALYDYNTQLENEAFLQAYNQQVQGLQGLAGLPSLAPSIASATSGIGQTLAQGEIAAAQAQQASGAQGFGNLLGLGQLGLQAYSSGLFSDERLKTNIEFIGTREGIPYYRWTWNERAASLGLTGEGEGVIAQEVEKLMPEAVSELSNGFKVVDMTMIGGGNGVSIRSTSGYRAATNG